MSRTLHGIGVSAGTASGPAVLVRPAPQAPANEEPTTDPAAAGVKVRAALEAVAEGLETRILRADDHAKPILEATAMMARDEGLLDSIDAQLASGRGLTNAVSLAVEEYCAMFVELGGYMAERVTDLRDVRDRAVSRLLGLPEPGIPELPVPSVLVAQDLAPAETATLTPASVLAIVTEAGGPTSHTAILAAQLGIPAVVQVAGAMEIEAGTTLAVEGSSGLVIVEPTAEESRDLSERARRRTAALAGARGPGRTKDGVSVQLLANIGTADDAVKAGACDVEGSGLFRTEFLFLGRDDAPSLAEQTATYTKVLAAFGTRKVVVRTLDAGADKPLAFADLGPEENPALGVRGLRLQREREDLLDTQLEALAAAAEATGATVWVLAPMIATYDEAEWFTAKVRSYGLPKAGTMIEVPAAAIRARDILEVCDFASIGTNDLAQYTFAADRMQGKLAPLLSGWQPALWDLIAATAEAGQALGKPVGICGETGGHAAFALAAAGLGVTSLSMATSKVAAVQTALAAHDLAQCQAIAAALRGARGPLQAQSSVLALADPVLTDLL